MASSSFTHLQHSHSIMKAQAKKANVVIRKIDMSSERFISNRNSTNGVGEVSKCGRGVEIGSETFAEIKILPIGNTADGKKGEHKQESLSSNHDLFLNLSDPEPLGSERCIFLPIMENDH
jgi:hypothetical protein